jgi:hypothetical protein
VKVRFLLDENLSPRLKVAVLRLNPAIDILRVGEPNAPPLGTLDPDVLRYLELSQRLLVTDNRTSMPEHLEAHWAEGGHIWGLFWVRHLRVSLPLTKSEAWAKQAKRLNKCWKLMA